MLLLFPAAGLAVPVSALPEDALAEDSPATATIERFYDGLLGVMRAGRQLSFDQRYDRLRPIILGAFDLAQMTRLAIGPLWPQLPPALQQQLSDAFTHYTVSVYTNRFDGYSGERFEVDPHSVPNANGVVVQSRLIQASGEKVMLNYLMREGAAGWQVIDVYLSGTVSELATRRSEFATVLRRDGPEGLVRNLDQRAAALRTG